MTLVVNRNFNRGLRSKTYGFGNIFEDFFDVHPVFTGHNCVKVEATESGHQISVAAPGLKKSDFSIQLKDGRLTISYQACDGGEEGKRRHLSREAFSKSWTVSKGTTPEDISAKYTAGVLKVSVSRPEQEVPEEHNIKIN